MSNPEIANLEKEDERISPFLESQMPMPNYVFNGIQSTPEAFKSPWMLSTIQPIQNFDNAARVSG